VFSFPNQFFDGARISLVRNVSSHMQVTHTLNVGGSTQPAGYRFAPMFAPENLEKSLLHFSCLTFFFFLLLLLFSSSSCHPCRVAGKLQNAAGQGSFPVLVGDVGTDGTLVAQVIHEPAANWRVKFQGQGKARQWVGGQLEVWCRYA
jgi:hypothetical protein